MPYLLFDIYHFTIALVLNFNNGILPAYLISLIPKIFEFLFKLFLFFHICLGNPKGVHEGHH